MTDPLAAVEAALDQALAVAREQWEGKTVVYKNAGDHWWGAGHRHQVEAIERRALNDMVVRFVCLEEGCGRNGELGLMTMDRWRLAD